MGCPYITSAMRGITEKQTRATEQQIYFKSIMYSIWRRKHNASNSYCYLRGSSKQKSASMSENEQRKILQRKYDASHYASVADAEAAFHCNRMLELKTAVAETHVQLTITTTTQIKVLPWHNLEMKPQNASNFSFSI